MKKIDNQHMSQIIGGDVIGSLCAGLSLGRAAIGIYNGLIAAGAIAGSAVATGGGVIIAVVAACSIYGLGLKLYWW